MLPPGRARPHSSDRARRGSAPLEWDEVSGVALFERDNLLHLRTENAFSHRTMHIRGENTIFATKTLGERSEVDTMLFVIAIAVDTTET